MTIMKRRKFIKWGIFGSTGLLTYSSGLTKRKAPSDTLNIGVIGTGDRGQALLSFINKTDGIDPVACCDILPFRLEAGLTIASKSGKVKGYEDYKKLLDNKDIDCVFISTPFSEHGHMAIDALDAGKHVYCEKTMVKGIEETKKVVDKVSSTEKIFQTGHQWHSSRLYTHVVEKIKEGDLGEIAAISCQWNRNGDWRREVPDPKWERLINWRMYKEYSGGLVAELCSHQMDITNWMLGSPPTKIMGTGGIDYWKDGRETYDNVHIIFEYPSGVKAKFTSLTTNALGDYQIKVLGKKGTITLDYREAWFYPEKKKDPEKGIIDGVTGASVKWDEAKGYPIEIDHIDPTLQAI
ncbi:uncharacterized protein METZ01_LOCUS90053, partial [marine metagenome]